MTATVESSPGRHRRLRLTRRRAIVASGGTIAAATIAASAPGGSIMAARQSATPVASPVASPVATPVGSDITLTNILFQNEEFDGQFLRLLDYIYHGGADFGESWVTARRIPDGDEDAWYTEWMALGDRIYADGEASLAEGHIVSAGDAFYRAAGYYRSAMIWLYKPPLDPRMVTAWERQRDAFQQAATLGPWTFEVIAVPYEDTTLEGYFLTPGGDGPFKTLVLVDGYDGTKEETYFSGGAAALERGYAVLLLDGPGQGGPLIEQGLHFRPDWEAVVTPQIDWLLTRDEVDPERIALMGRSWGGYLAPRAATAEHRIAALVADAAQYSTANSASAVMPPGFIDEIEHGDPGPINEGIETGMAQDLGLAFTMNRGMFTMGADTPVDFLKKSLDYSLEGIAGNIQAPTLITSAENDPLNVGARPLFDAITAPKEFMLFTNAEGAGQHDEAGAAAFFSQRVFDWLDRILG